ncbi:tyrosine-type recombinase/integrase [Streptomyces sp. NPDC093546]|uniref:tyrosine-type recombinase/integrase n=1 Tax=Streptomyces sp. NPDC093546 TaxID=3366040 RepID=UPI0038236D8F
MLDAGFRSRQQAEFKAAGKAWSKDGLVFPNENGQLRTALDVRRHFRAQLRDAGVDQPHEWTTRELRTSLVSLLSDHGIPIEVIARVVGHSGSGTTEKVYRKQLRPVIEEGAKAMDDIFGRDDAPAGNEGHEGPVTPPVAP